MNFTIYERLYNEEIDNFNLRHNRKKNCQQFHIRIARCNIEQIGISM